MTITTSRLMMPRPYGAGYQAPSTALYITDKATLSMGKSSGPVILKSARSFPDYMELLLEVVPVSLKMDPLITAGEYARNVFGEILPAYQHSSIKLMATDVLRLNGQFGRVIDHLEIWLPEDKVVYELTFDCILHDIVLNLEEDSPVWALGGFYQEGGALDKIRQAFITFYVQNDAIQHRLSHLEEWWERGLRPPNGLTQDNRLVNATREVPYLSMLDALRQGEAMVCVRIGVDEKGEDLLETYHSIDAVAHGVGQVMVTFKR